MVEYFGKCQNLWPTVTAEMPFYGGLFGGWPQSTVVDYVQKTYLPTVSKSALDNMADMVYQTYVQVIKDGWKLFDATPATTDTAKEVQKRTGQQFLYVYSILKALYTLAKTGKIEGKWWNPAQGDKIAATKSKELAAFFSPIASFGSGLLNKVLIIAGLGATAYFVLPKLLASGIKAKAKAR